MAERKPVEAKDVLWKPIVNPALKATEYALRRAFGIQYPLYGAANVLIVSQNIFLDRDRYALEQKNALARDVPEHGLPLDLVIDQSAASTTVVDGPSGPSYYFSVADIGPFLAMAPGHPSSNEVASVGASFLSKHLVNLILDHDTKPVTISRDTRVLKFLSEQVIETLEAKAKDKGKTSEIKDYLQELRSRFTDVSNLSLVGKGIQLELRDGELTLLYLMRAHQKVILDILTEEAYKSFVTRMREILPWFVHPDRWNPVFKSDARSPEFIAMSDQLKDVLKNEGLLDPKKLVESFLNSELAISISKSVIAEITGEDPTLGFEESTAQQAVVVGTDEKITEISKTPRIKTTKNKRPAPAKKTPIKNQPKRPLKKTQAPQNQKPVQIESSPVEALINQVYADGSGQEAEKLGRPQRVDEIIKIAIKSLKEFYPDLPVLPEESFNLLSSRDFWQIYDSTHQVRNRVIQPPKLPSSFQDESVYPPQVYLSADEFSDIESEDLELKTLAEWELAKTIIQNFILFARTPKFYNHPHEPFWTEALQKAIEKGRIFPPQKYPIINEENLQVGILTYTSLTEEDETSQIALDGAEIKFRILPNTTGNDFSYSEVTRAGEELELAVSVYIASILVETMIDSMSEFYPEDLQVEARKRYKSYLTPSREETERFASLNKFLESIGLSNFSAIISAHSKSEIPLLYMQAKTQDPDLEYPS